MFSCDSHAQSEPAWKEDTKTFGNADRYILLVRKFFLFFFGNKTFGNSIASPVDSSKAMPTIKLDSVALDGMAGVTVTR